MIVVWRVTERCNLACGFCAYDRRLERERAEATPEAMLVFGAALADYQRRSGDPVLVSWLGGEPFLWKALPAVTRAFVQDLGLRVSVTTNGTTLGSSAVRAHVLDHYAELTISVDAFAPVHDALRGWRGGFARLRGAVGALATEKQRRGHGPLLRANVVLMRDTVRDFERLALELATWGIEEITFNQLGGNDRPEYHPAHRLTTDDVERLADRLEPLRGRLAEVGTSLRGGARYVERIRSTAAGRRLPVDECAPGTQFLFVSEHGIASPCSFTSQAYGVPVAELATADDVLALPARFAAVRAARRSSWCDDCPSTQVFDKFDGADG